VILGLGIATIATVQRKPQLVLTATSVEGEEVESLEEFNEIEIATIEELSMDESAFEPLPEMTDVQVTDVQVSDVELSVTSAESVMAAATATGDSSDAAGGKPSSKPKADRVSKHAVQFCGTAAAGNRFAFVVDNSRSMVKGRMLATIDQLLTALDHMSPKQEFFVVLYSDTAYPMLFPDSATEFLPATRPNKKQLREWLKTIELNSGGNYEAALDVVFDLQPDVIFLLGDGGGLGQDEVEMLTGFNPKRKCVINTIGVGAGRVGSEKLLRIARANRGVFRPFPISGAYVQMAQGVRFPINPPSRSWAKRLGK
jgi:hypothetical protein